MYRFAANTIRERQGFIQEWGHGWLWPVPKGFLQEWGNGWLRSVPKRRLNIIIATAQVKAAIKRITVQQAEC